MPDIAACTTAGLGYRLCGRREITYDPELMSNQSIVETLSAVLPIHQANRDEIDYLWNYYKGNTPIFNKIKTVRPELNARISVNHAYQIVSFNVGYLLGEPIQYVSRSDDSSVLDGIGQLNAFMFEEDAGSVDVEVAEWFNICGTAYKIILPDGGETEPDSSPFEVYSLDPRNTFVVYSHDVSRRPLFAVSYVKNDRGAIVYSVYTRDRFYRVTNNEIVEEADNPCGEIPIIEYPANKARLGAFEIVLSLLDTINSVESNREDAIEQFVQAFMVFIGANIDAEKLTSLKDQGALLLPENADVKYLVQELNQTETQTFVNEMYQTILTICGLPNRNGGTSTSDTGSAVIYRDGWEDAESRAKKVEMLYKKSEKRLLRIALSLCRTLSDGFRDKDIKLSDIEIRFTRRNYENIQVKSQVLTTMLDNEKIARKLAFEVCGLFPDPDLAYKTSEDQYQEILRKEGENDAEDDSASLGNGTGSN